MAKGNRKSNDSTRYGSPANDSYRVPTTGRAYAAGDPSGAYDRLMAVFDKLSAHYGPVAVLYSEQAADGSSKSYLISPRRNEQGLPGEQGKHCTTCTCAGHGGLEKALGSHQERTSTIKPANDNYRRAA